VGAVGSIVSVKVLTTYLSPEQYGQFSLGLTAAVLTGQILSGPLSAATTRFFAPSTESLRLEPFITATFDLLAHFAGIVLTIATLCGLVWLLHPSIIVATLAVALLLSLITGAEQILDSIQNAARHRGLVAWHLGLGPWLRFACAVALFKVAGTTTVSAICGYLFGASVLLLSQYGFFRWKIGKPRLTRADRADARDLEKRMLRYAWPFGIWGIFTSVQLASDRWALGIFQDLHSVGVYNVAYQLGYYPVLLASTALMQVASPILFATAGDASEVSRVRRTRSAALRLSLISVILTTLGFIVLLNLDRDLFGAVVGPGFRGATIYLPYLFLAGGVFAAGQFAIHVPLIEFDTKGALFTKITTALIGTALNFVGAAVWGVKGVVGATLAFSFLYLVAMLRLSRTRSNGQQTR
jgi:O-antigen/teichoic acid export membrane protein